jgi:hypothetical protein
VKDAKDRPVWFSEPSQADDSWGRRGESLTSWVERATLSRARATRRFLNENLSMLPKEHQAALYRALHDRWPSAFFELIVARTLQVLGASIEIEPGGAEDIRIDFVASFPDSTVSVEAVAPAFNLEIGEQVKQRNPLLDIIESSAPPHLWVLVESLPELGPSDSKKRFKNMIKRLLADAAKADISSPTEFVEELPQGTLRLKVIPKSPNASTARSIGSEPALTTLDDTEQRVRRAVGRKRRQGRESATPTLLAVHATEMSSSYDAFDRALFGQTFTRLGQDSQVLGTGFDAHGIFNKGTGTPTWAGVLAFVGISLRGGPDPVLYLHPRLEGALPDALLSLERRTYDTEAKRIVILKPSATGILEKMGFVPPDV